MKAEQEKYANVRCKLKRNPSSKGRGGIKPSSMSLLTRDYTSENVKKAG